MSSPLLSIHNLKGSSDLRDDITGIAKALELRMLWAKRQLLSTNETGLGKATAPPGPFPHGPVCGGEKGQGAGAVTYALRQVAVGARCGALKHTCNK